jgi:hypothetical protein
MGIWNYCYSLVSVGISTTFQTDLIHDPDSLFLVDTSLFWLGWYENLRNFGSVGRVLFEKDYTSDIGQVMKSGCYCRTQEFLSRLSSSHLKSQLLFYFQFSFSLSWPLPAFHSIQSSLTKIRRRGNPLCTLFYSRLGGGCCSLVCAHVRPSGGRRCLDLFTVRMYHYILLWSSACRLSCFICYPILFQVPVAMATPLQRPSILLRKPCKSVVTF